MELLERYDKIQHSPMGNQMEASTTAVTAGSAERPFAKVFAFMWYTTATLLQLPLIEVGNAVRADCYSIASYP